MKNETLPESSIPIYEPGSVVYAKANPAIELSVLRYSHGIYYCAIIGDAQYNNLPYLACQLQQTATTLDTMTSYQQEL